MKVRRWVALALVALVSLIVPRSEPTTAPFGFPNCRCAFTSRLANNWRSPALALFGGTSTLDSDVVIETRRMTDGGAAPADGETATEAVTATIRAAGTTRRNTSQP